MPIDLRHKQSKAKTTMKLSASLLLVASLGASTNAFVSQQALSSKLSSSTTELFASRKPFITGNWKLNPQTKAEAVDLARGIAAAIEDGSTAAADVALFVPFPFLETVQKIVGDKLSVGAEVSLSFSQICSQLWV